MNEYVFKVIENKSFAVVFSSLDDSKAFDRADELNADPYDEEVYRVVRNKLS